MGELLNDPNAIQSHIESLIYLEEANHKKLQQEADELKKQYAQSNAQVNIMDSVSITSSLIPGKKVFLKLNGSTLSLLQGKMKSVFKAPDSCMLRFVMTNGSSALLRNNNDFNIMAHYCSANQINPIQIELVTETQLPIITPNDLFETPITKVTRVVLLCTPEFEYGVLLNLPEKLDFEKGKELIFKVLHPTETLVLEDSDGDDVEISSPGSWSYLYDETLNQTRRGNYLKLSLK